MRSGQKLIQMLAKDWSLIRFSFGVGVLACVSAPALAAFLHLPGWANEGWSAAARAAQAGISMWILIGPALCAQLVAVETSDRSLRFLVELPCTSSQILASKLVLSAAMLVLVSSVGLLVTGAAQRAFGADDLYVFALDYWPTLVMRLCAVFTAWAAAWFCAALLPRPGAAAAVGVSVGGAVAVVGQLRYDNARAGQQAIYSSFEAGIAHIESLLSRACWELGIISAALTVAAFACGWILGQRRIARAAE